MFIFTCYELYQQIKKSLRKINCMYTTEITQTYFIIIQKKSIKSSFILHLYPIPNYPLKINRPAQLFSIYKSF